MKIVSTSAAFDVGSGDWVAKICNENAFRPVRLGFRSSVPIPKATPTGPAFATGDSEEVWLLKGLQNGYQVYLHRTLCAPGTYGDCRNVVFVDYETDNSDSVMHIYSETPHPNDVVSFLVKADAWPKNFARIDFDRHVRPMGFMGVSQDIGLQPYTPTAYSAIPGGGVTVRHNDHFVLSAAIDEQLVAGSYEYFEVDQVSGATSPNRHHIQPYLASTLRFTIHSSIARDMIIDANTNINGYSIAGGASFPLVSNQNEAISIPAGDSDLYLFFDPLDTRPDAVTFRSVNTSEEWTIRITDYNPKVIIQYKTLGGVYTSFGTSTPGTYNLTEPIVTGGQFSFVQSNCQFNDIIPNATIVQRYTGPVALVEEYNNATIQVPYPLSYNRPPDYANPKYWVDRYYNGALPVTHANGIIATVNAGSFFVRINIPRGI